MAKCLSLHDLMILKLKPFRSDDLYPIAGTDYESPQNRPSNGS